MKDAYYFSHDSNARNDPKICMMRVDYGCEGYGWYWIIIEMLRDESEYKMRLQYARKAVAMQLQCTPEAAEKFLKNCMEEYELFESDGEHFWSNSLIRRMGKKDEKSERARQAALSRWEKQGNADDKQTHSERNAIKEKEKKGKENIYTPEFETFYNTYPNPANKMQTFTNWKTVIKKYGHAEILRSAERYGKEVGGKDKQYIVVSSNFIGKKSTYLDYLDENYTQKQSNKETRIGVMESDSDLGPKEEAWM